MVDIKVIKQTYAQMPDKKLQLLAEEGLDDLTSDAKAALYDEFLKRGIGTSAFKAFNDLKAELKRQSVSAQWEAAFNERKAGKTDEEIQMALETNGMDSRNAALIIKRLPQIDYVDEAFENLVFESCQVTSHSSIWGLLILFGASALLIYWAVKMNDLMFLMIALVVAVLAFFFRNRFIGNHKGGKYWVDMLRNRPENIVWIKPIILKHTVYYVLTLFKEREFQFLTKEGMKVLMKCNSTEDQEIFVDGVRNYLPHAQFGYSLDIAVVYEDDPKDFIDVLVAKGLYTPIDMIRRE